MNKVIRIISIVLLGAAAAAMFLFYNPIINGASPKDLVVGNDIVKYVLGGLLVLSAFLTLRVFGFKTLKVSRIIIGLIAIGLPIAVRFIPNKEIPIGPASLDLSYTIIGGGYIIVFLLLFFMHFIEIFRRKGVSKIFIPFADLGMIVLVFGLYIYLCIPALQDHADQAPAALQTVLQYVSIAMQYAHYVIGGLLAAAGVSAVVELFVRKQAK